MQQKANKNKIKKIAKNSSVNGKRRDTGNERSYLLARDIDPSHLTDITWRLLAQPSDSLDSWMADPRRARNLLNGQSLIEHRAERLFCRLDMNTSQCR